MSLRPEVNALRDFYDSGLGRITAQLVANRIHSFWPDLDNRHVAGLGFATPYLDLLDPAAASRVAFMPAPQGAELWRTSGGNATTLVEETALPLPDGAFDYVVLAHSLDVADDLAGLLQEAWRILNPGGRLAVVVAKRRGLWSAWEGTPFGQGRPYSPTQLRGLLANHLLPVSRSASAMFLPPSRRLSLPKLFFAAEKVGQTVLRPWGGLLIVEAKKQIEGGIKIRPKRASVRARVTAPVGAVPTRRDQSGD